MFFFLCQGRICDNWARITSKCCWMSDGLFGASLLVSRFSDLLCLDWGFLFLCIYLLVMMPAGLGCFFPQQQRHTCRKNPALSHSSGNPHCGFFVPRGGKSEKQLLHPCLPLCPKELCKDRQGKGSGFGTGWFGVYLNGNYNFSWWVLLHMCGYWVPCDGWSLYLHVHRACSWNCLLFSRTRKRLYFYVFISRVLGSKPHLYNLAFFPRNFTLTFEEILSHT